MIFSVYKFLTVGYTVLLIKLMENKMVEVTDNAVAVNQQIFNEIVGHRDAAKALWLKDGSEHNYCNYNIFNAQVNHHVRVCINLGIKLKMKGSK